jgi:anaerobic ribonucleoside-triphosphate reductase activating protein
MIKLNLAHTVPCTDVEGPGKRFALWCQGCLRRCPGCCNPGMQAREINHLVEVKDLFAQIKEAVQHHAIEGVTFLGGEPFLQAQGLYELAGLCREAGLTVMAFSGYTLEELEKSRSRYRQKLLARLDLLLDGPFLNKEPESHRPWAGSANQRFHYLTGAYDKSIEQSRHDDGLEIRIDREGRILINGNPLAMRCLDLDALRERTL